MRDVIARTSTLPARPGVGYKPQHFSAIMAAVGSGSAPVGWLEIHAENYMGAGGRPLAQLRHLADHFPISVHGVGLSIGGETPLDTDHLARLKHLVDWLNPASFSEHLAWSSHDTQFLNDLLPLPYNAMTLEKVASHIDQVQTTLGRQMLLENPSSYLAFSTSDMSETDFLRELTRRTGCGLLLDVNNVFISATNLGTSPQAYIDGFPLQAVREIHLGGHDDDADENGALLLIDSHGRAVADPVWALLDYTLARSGPKPLLIEWDNNVPDWPVLATEAMRAGRALSALRTARAAA